MKPLVAVILSFLWKHGQTKACDTAFSLSNHKLHGHVIKNHSVQSISTCVLEKCALHSDCQSINYNSHQGICELNNANHLTNPESLVLSEGSQYLHYVLRPSLRCSNKLCSSPRVCVVDKKTVQNYKCVTCEDEDAKEVISFPRKSVEDKVVYEVPNDFQLTDVTVSMWVQADPSTDNHTPFSYATISENNELVVLLSKTYTELEIASISDRDYPSVLDGKWHHLCVTWQSLDGTYEFYIDGVKQGDSKRVHKGRVIQKGALILGQEQDSYKGGFETFQSLQGNLTSVNMWDKVLTDQEVSALSLRCPTEEGNIITWSALKTKISSGLKMICSNPCLV